MLLGSWQLLSNFYGEKEKELRVKLREAVKEKYKQQPINTEDGVRIDFERSWIHLRKSNTEPVVRLNVESRADPALMASKTEETRRGIVQFEMCSSSVRMRKMG